jgi:hypothetical protein
MRINPATKRETIGFAWCSAREIIVFGTGAAVRAFERS